MSNARNKNVEAMKSLLGDGALAARLEATRLAVVLPQALPTSAELLVTVLADVLGRLWPCIHFHGTGADAAQLVACAAAVSGGSLGDAIKSEWAPPYDVVVAVGCDAPAGTANVVRVGANGWTVGIGPDASCGENPNPVGPAFVAALAGAQVFYRVFRDALGDIDAAPIETWSADMRTLFNASDLDVQDLYLDETHVFGVGAVTHGAVWLLEHWPAPVNGVLRLVDRDKYGSTNGQRYAFMRPEDVGALKVEAVKARLRARHRSLIVTPHPTDLNTYCAERGYVLPLRRVIAGLDSAESRRHAGLKLPGQAINMWTHGERVGAGRYRQAQGSACIACGYLEEKISPRDEVAELHLSTGLRPDVIRSLLDSARGLAHEEATQVARKWNVPVESIAGEPLRSVMPILCATGTVAVQPGSAPVEVPFAFASLLAGIAGFMMLIKDLRHPNAQSVGWTQHVFKSPSRLMLQELTDRAECVVCSQVVAAIED